MQLMRLRRLLVPLLALAALTAPAAARAATTAPTGTTSVISIDSGGITRSYRLFVPSVLPAGPRPLVLSLHGFSLTGAMQETGTNLDKVAAKAGILVAYPDGLGNGWNAGNCCGTSVTSNVDDVAFLSSVVRDIATRYSVDRLRTAVSGFSNGAMMSYRFACERADLVDTIIAMAGTYVAPGCPMARPLNLLHMHGLLDATVPYNGGVIPVTGTKVRPAYGPVGAVAQLDGCSSFDVVPSLSALVTTTEGQGCPAGITVRLVTSATLKHTWPTGPTAVSTYGFDATDNLWGFLSGVWSTRGTPVAL